MRLSTRRRNLLVLLGFGLLAVVCALWFDGGAGGGALDAVPKGSFLVASVDVEALRGSPLGAPIFRFGAARSLVAPYSEACGWDVLGRLRDLVLAVPEAEGSGEFGLIARVHVTRDELVSCSDRLVGARSGTPRVTKQGSFSLLEDVGNGGAAPRPKLALGNDGTILVGGGAWFASMLEAAEGRAPRIADNVEHAALRRKLVASSKQHRPVLLVTATLPAQLRARLKGELADDVTATRDGSAAAMEGILEVRAIGALLATGPTGSETELLFEFECTSAASCDEVRKLVLRKRLLAQGDLRLRLAGMGPLLDSLTATVHGSALSVVAHAPTDALAATLERLLGYLANAGEKPLRPSAPVVAVPPDERLPSSGDAGARAGDGGAKR